MTLKPFIGRTLELKKLQDLYRKGIPNLVVVKGRRRVGKSRLIVEFAARNKQIQLWGFSGLAPQEGLTGQNQRDHFARQLATLLKTPPFTFQDWSDAFNHLSLQVKDGDIILFDEISWMSTKDPSFIPKLKAWWDQQTKHIIVIFCGSVSTWIEENILKSAAFFGRVNLTLTLEPLSITESNLLLKAIGFQSSPYDTYKLLSVLGGIPWYLEQAIQGISADNLIKQLCFEKDGMLVLEFDRIFHDLFNGKGAAYKKILNSLKEGTKTLLEIRQNIDFAHSGTLSQLMDNLITAGFVRKQSLWSFKTIKTLKQSLYQLSDPYMRFYLKVIEPLRNKIELATFTDTPLSSLPSLDAHIGLQLEYLLLQNRSLLIQSIGISPIDIVCDGPYRQSQSLNARGCQIDYLVQTFTKNLFVCEFKFKRREIGIEVIDEMQEKINSLKIPKGYAAVPILFHIGGVSPSVETNNYFYRIVDITEFLETL